MKKIAFLLLISFLFFSCEKPTDPVSEPEPEPPQKEISFAYRVDSVSMEGKSDGKIYITSVSNGIAPYQYKLEKGNYQNEDHFDNLTSGSYCISVKDNTGRIASDDVAVGIKKPVSPVNPALTFTLSTTDAIYGLPTGSITVSITSDPASPYTYSIEGPINSTSGSIYNFSYAFNNLPAGEYKITATDNYQQVIVQNITINQPALPLPVYSPASISVPLTLYQSPYLNAFSGRNRFSVAFRYTTSGNEVNYNSNKPTSDGFGNNPSLNEATLLSISNSNTAGGSNPLSSTGVFEIRLIKNNAIYCKRFVKNPTGTPTLEGDQIWNFDPNIWKGAYVVITYDGTDLKFYLNGVLMGTDKNRNNINGTITSAVEISNDLNIYIGTGDSYFPTADNTYNGSITDFKIYEEALTSTDVAGLFSVK
jgi:hypothetical protein